MIKKLQYATFKFIDILMILTMLLGSPMSISASAMAQDPAPVLGTDKSDYAPGESANVTGSGFAPDGAYVLAANGPDGQLDWGSVTADGSGGFTSNPHNVGSAGNYEVRAYASGWGGSWDETYVANATFTVTEPPPPTETPTEEPTAVPTDTPTTEPTVAPTDTPTTEPTVEPTTAPTDTPTTEPTVAPTDTPTAEPTPLPPPYIQSDKADYAPGELVTLTGGNWQGDTTVRIIVNDDIGQAWRRDVTVPVAGDGTIYDSFNLPTFFIANYSVTARGQQTNRVATTTFTDLSIGTYDQCSNDDGDGYASGDTDCRWINGNLQSNNSTYFEGDATVQRLWLTGFIPGSTHTVTLKYGTTKGGKHAYDFLTTWDWSEDWIPVADRCQDITGCTSASESTVDIPQDPNVPNSFEPSASGDRQFVMRGGTLNSATTPAIVSGSYAGDSETIITINFTVGSSSGPMCPTSGPDAGTCSVALWFGAHVAAQANWGLGQGAGSISGSPYHVALDKIDGASVGQRDNQMQANAVTVIPNGTIIIVKDAVPNDPQDFSFVLTNNSTITQNFSLDDDSDGTLPSSQTFSVPPGTWTATELNIPTGWSLTDLDCQVVGTNGSSFAVDLGTATATISLESNDTVTCTFTDTNAAHIIVDKVTIPSGDPQSFSFTTTGSGYIGFSLTDATAPNDQTLASGMYSVSETVPAGWDLTSATCVSSIGDTESPASIELDAGETVTCTFTNVKASVTVVKTGDELSKVGDSVTYSFTITNTSSAGSPNLILDSVGDSLLGDLTADATTAGCGSLAPGAFCNFTKSYTVQAGDPDPLPNTVTVHYHLSGFATDVSASDSHSVELFQPAVDIEKTGDTVGKIGDEVTYTYTIHNLSSSDTPNLVLASLIDDKVGDLTLNADYDTACDELTFNETCSFSVTWTIPSGASDPYTNTVEVHYNPDGFPNDIIDSDSHSVELFQPAINLTKTGDTLSKIGDAVDYVITLENNSSTDTPDLSCTVTDATLGVSESFSVAAGLDHVINVTGFVIPDGASDPFVNTASVTCSPAGFSNVYTDEASWSTDLFQPAINLTKTGDALSKIGDAVDYVITLENNSSADTPDLSCTVTDATVGVSESFSVAAGADHVINVNGFVIPDGASDPFVNTASVTCSPAGFPNVYEDSATWETNLFQPAINLTKTGDTLSKIGDAVDYVITLENNSSADTPDLSCTVTDATVGVSETFTVAAGADHVINVNGFVIPDGASDPFVNTASVTCSPAGFSNVYEDSATWETNLFQPAINLTKTGDALSKIGDAVDYVITLENNSSADTPDLSCTITDATVGVSETFSVAVGLDHVINVNGFVIPDGASDPFVNTASVTCSPAGFSNVYTDEASWSTDLFQPAINLTKTGDALSKIGDAVDYVITLENNSSADTPDLSCTVTDATVGVNESFTVAAGADHVINVNGFVIPDGASDPFVNTASVTCSPAGFTNVYTDEASHSVNLFTADFEISKIGDVLSKIGDEVTYTYTIHNLSSDDAPSLLLTDLVDDKVGDLTLNAGYNTACDELAFDETCSFNVTWTIPGGASDPYTNTVTATYQVSGFSNTYTHSASHSVNLFQPAIELTKTGDALSKIGDAVDYVITLSNTSSTDTPDLSCTVTDATVGVSESFTVAAGLDHVINVNGFVIPDGASDPFVNTASVTCSPEGFSNVYEDTASWSTELFQPAIELTKTGDTLSKIGDAVDYVITLENNSSADTPDLSCTVTDATVGVSETFTVAAGADHVINVNGFVIPDGASDPFVNTASVTCSPAGFTNVYTDEASWETNLFQPAINLTKSAETLSKAGDPVEYTITLENNSSADTPDLTCTITDTTIGFSKDVTLASGVDDVSTVPFTIPADFVGDDFVNTASVTCSPEGFPNVYGDEASWSIELFQPSITFDKTGDELSKKGDPTDYTITLNNTSSGDTPDLTCNVTDAAIDVDETVTLAAGDPAFVINATVPIPADATDPYVNTASVSCSVAGFPNVLTASESHSVNLFQPSVVVVKTGPTAAAVGQSITYNFTISNNSSSDSPNLILDSMTDAGTGWAGLGDLTATASANGCGSLASGATCTFSVNYTIQASDPNPLKNTVTVHYHPDGFPNDISDSDDHSVTIVPPSLFTDTSFCPLTGPFRLLYHLNTLSPTTYRLQASNPGQFYYNVFYVGNPGDTVTLSIEVPYPFITQEGAGVPIQVHDMVTDTNSNGCTEPGPRLDYNITTEDDSVLSSSGNPIITFADYTSGTTIGTSTTEVKVTGAIPSTGLLYVTIHLDYGLKKTLNWSRGEFGGTNDSLDARQGSGSGVPTILNEQAYNFSFTDGSNTFTSTPTSVNEFKRFAGFMGFVTSSVDSTPIPGVTVEIRSPTNALLATVTTDADGFYFYAYKHKAKSATYTIKLPAPYNVQQSVTIKANGFGVVNFTVP